MIANQSPVDVIDTLKYFLVQYKDERYRIFFLRPDQGRGLDFGTSPEIEANGGVHVIVSVLPKRYLQYR
jgi:hypothetical protein